MGFKRKQLLIFLLVLMVGGSLSQAELKSPWLRVDGDTDGVTLWFGGTIHTKSVKINHEILYFTGLDSFQTDVGPYFSFAKGKLDLCPMMGVFLDLKTGQLKYVVPQLYLFSTIGKLYIEAWNLYFMGVSDETRSFPYFYGRYFMQYSLTKWLSIGPHLECIYDLPKDFSNELASLKLGASLGFEYGKKSRLTIFLGVDTKDENHFATRITFVYNL